MLRDRWLTVSKNQCLLPNKKIIDDFYLLKRPNWAVVFAVTDKNEVVLVEQYKYGVDKIIWELPAGAIDQIDKSPVAGARRELAEETGYGGGRWFFLGQWFCEPSGQDNLVYAYLALGVKKIGKQKLDPAENIKVRFCRLAKIKALVKSNKIKTQGHVAAVYKGLEKIDSDFLSTKK